MLKIVSNIIRFVFLILIQGVVVNEIKIWDGMMLPYVYIFAILMLPFETPRWLVLVISFAAGIAVDSFTDTLGMHTSACVLLGFLQPLVASALAPRDGYEINQQATVQSMGLSWYLLYAGILTLAHHSWLFFMEVFRFQDFFGTMLRVLVSSAGTLVLLFIGQYLIYKPSKSIS